MKNNPDCMISTEGCFMFRHDSDIMELNKGVSSHPVELGQVFTYILSRKPEFLTECLFLTSWLLPALVSTVALSLIPTFV